LSTGQNDEHLSRKRVCLLTGASGKLGTAFCRMLASKYHIAAVYRRNPPQVPSQHQRYIDPLDLATSIPENDHSIFAIQADLTDDKELARIVELTLARFGRIDLVVNAAVHYVFAPIVDSDRLLENLYPQFLVNTMVPLKLATQVARSFWRDRDQENIRMNRNVINVSSVSGLHIYPYKGQSVYSASKAALNYLTRHMACEFRTFGIRVNAAAPTSFPQIVSVESVVQALFHLDQGDMTGKILILDKDGERLT
jgi:NAD(P)-dependent dehydrogenase (short-subunit alcohol dehydrogenase family)